VAGTKNPLVVGTQQGRKDKPAKHGWKINTVILVKRHAVLCSYRKRKGKISMVVEEKLLLLSVR
jgi:hypothetical protein